jgi:hypothetical protein
LEDHAAIRTRSGDWNAVNINPSCRRFEQAVTQVNKRGLAATAGSDDGDELTVVDL